jgi:hypothetical protein
MLRLAAVLAVLGLGGTQAHHAEAARSTAATDARVALSWSHGMAAPRLCLLLPSLLLAVKQHSAAESQPACQ